MCERRPSRTYCRARDKEDLQERIRAFELVPVHATAYCRHTGNNCLSFIKGVRNFIIKLKSNEATVISS
jgi:hypothetical protein